MKNNNIPNCCARTHGGSSPCKNPGTYMEAVSVKGSNAWSRDSKKNAAEGLIPMDIPVCGTHRNQLKKRSAIAFYLKAAPVVEQLTLEIPEATEKVLTPSEGMRLKIKGGVSCGNCHKNTGKEVKHATINDVRRCYAERNAK